MRVIHPQNDVQVGMVNIAKTRTLNTEANLPEIENICIKPASQAAGDNDNGVPLKRYIDQNNFFTILFSDSRLVYLTASLYKDDSLVDGRTLSRTYALMHVLNVAIKARRERLRRHILTFDADSVLEFSLIASRPTMKLFQSSADDLGDEWADFIGINGNHQPKTISFTAGARRPLKCVSLKTLLCCMDQEPGFLHKSGTRGRRCEIGKMDER